jgi:hypothetical protein
MSLTAQTLLIGIPCKRPRRPFISLLRNRIDRMETCRPNHLQYVTFPPRPGFVTHLILQSPTTAIAQDSYLSAGGQSSTSTLSGKVLIVVTADSERYLTVDITSATGPAFIRERIFTKVCRLPFVSHEASYSLLFTSYAYGMKNTNPSSRSIKPRLERMRSARPSQMSGYSNFVEIAVIPKVLSNSWCRIPPHLSTNRHRHIHHNLLVLYRQV